MESSALLVHDETYLRQTSGESFLDDVESPDPVLEQEGTSCTEDDVEDKPAKEEAREKFEWLTCHAVVRRSRAASHQARIGSCDFEDKEKDEDPLPTLRQRAHAAADATPAADAKMAREGSYRSATRYLSACSNYNLTPNGGALLGLSLGLEMLEVDGTLTNLELVPLCAALLDATFVKHLKLSGHPLQDTGAAVLALALPGCPWIRELELVGCRITGAGVQELCETLPKSGISRLVLRGNLLRQNAESANAALARLVANAKQLKSLDLQSCGLKSEGMRAIKTSLAEREQSGLLPCTVDFEGNFVLVEVLNSVSHGICALVCLEAWRRLNNLVIRLCHFSSRLSVTLYVVSMMTMFAGSTLYHSMFSLTHISWFFRMIDHCAIYFLIAGTYTPVLVMGCRDIKTLEVQPAVPVVVSIYWVLVALGIFMEHVFVVRTPPWYSKFVLGMYVVLGFGGVPYIATCSLVHEGDVMSWIELGGLTYVVGIVFFLLDRRYPAMHVIWHILVGLAAFFHFVGVWNLTTAVLRDKHRSCESHDRWEYGAIAAMLGWDAGPMNGHTIHSTEDPA